MSVTAVYPGTFDPLTNGHVDLVARAAKLFDSVIVGIAENPYKSTCFELSIRIELAECALEQYSNVTVRGFNELLVAFAQACQAQVIIRGLRTVTDFEYECQLAGVNRQIAPQLETVFLTPQQKNAYISSSAVREIASYQGDVSQFVPIGVAQALQQKFVS